MQRGRREQTEIGYNDYVQHPLRYWLWAFPTCVAFMFVGAIVGAAIGGATATGVGFLTATGIWCVGFCLFIYRGGFPGWRERRASKATRPGDSQDHR